MATTWSLRKVTLVLVALTEKSRIHRASTTALSILTHKLLKLPPSSPRGLTYFLKLFLMNNALICLFNYLLTYLPSISYRTLLPPPNLPPIPHWEQILVIQLSQTQHQPSPLTEDQNLTTSTQYIEKMILSGVVCYEKDSTTSLHPKFLIKYLTK